MKVRKGVVWVVDGWEEMTVLKTGDSKSIIFKAGLKKPAARAEQTLSLDKSRKTQEMESVLSAFKNALGVDQPVAPRKVMTESVGVVKPGVGDDIVRETETISLMPEPRPVPVTEGVMPAGMVMEKTATGMRYGTLKNPGKNVFVKGRNGKWMAASDGMVILPGDEVRTIGTDTVELMLDNDNIGHIKVDGGSIFRIKEMNEDQDTKDQTTLLELALGKMLLKVEPLKGNSKFEVKTPTAVTSVHGTVFEVEVNALDAA